MICRYVMQVWHGGMMVEKKNNNYNMNLTRRSRRSDYSLNYKLREIYCLSVIDWSDDLVKAQKALDNLFAAYPDRWKIEKIEEKNNVNVNINNNDSEMRDNPNEPSELSEPQFDQQIESDSDNSADSSASDCDSDNNASCSNDYMSQNCQITVYYKLYKVA